MAPRTKEELSTIDDYDGDGNCWPHTNDPQRQKPFKAYKETRTETIQRMEREMQEFNDYNY